MTVLVTGGTGTLGRALVPVLLREGYPVRVMSRRPRITETQSELGWVRADLSTGDGLTEAVQEVDTVVHLASAPYRGPLTTRVDVQGTARLITAARHAGVRHLVFVSIVGVDVVGWGYFRKKLATESVVANGSVGWSVVRFTQFHGLLDGALRAAGRLPVAIVDAGISAQPVDPSDAAERLVHSVRQGPSSTIEDFAGPETLTGDELVRQWLEARGRTSRVVSVSVPGQLGRAFRAGGITSDTGSVGRITWADYLADKYANSVDDRDEATKNPHEGTGPGDGPAAPAGAGRSRTPIVDPERKRRAVLWFERHVQNPAVRAAFRSGLPLPMFALLETTGWRTGLARRTPIINGLTGDTFWIVSEHGRRSAYVRNLEANPRLRIQVRGRWYTGTALILDEDDPIARAGWMSRELGPWHKADRAAARLFGTQPLTIRVDLDRTD